VAISKYTLLRHHGSLDLLVSSIAICSDVYLCTRRILYDLRKLHQGDCEEAFSGLMAITLYQPAMRSRAKSVSISDPSYKLARFARVIAFAEAASDS
jgi:hypothetical protein